MESAVAESRCRACLEPIQPGAKRCPHCRTAQEPWYHSPLAYLVFALSVTPLYVALVVRSPRTSPGHKVLAWIVGILWAMFACAFLMNP